MVRHKSLLQVRIIITKLRNTCAGTLKKSRHSLKFRGIPFSEKYSARSIALLVRLAAFERSLLTLRFQNVYSRSQDARVAGVERAKVAVRREIYSADP